jgi:hypothetical protein
MKNVRNVVLNLIQHLPNPKTNKTLKSLDPDPEINSG